MMRMPLNQLREILSNLEKDSKKNRKLIHVVRRIIYRKQTPESQL